MAHPSIAREILLSIATGMLDKNWQPVWCPARQSGGFSPLPGTTGGYAPYPSVEPQPPGAHHLAFRMPPNVVSFDVDHYDGKRGADTMDRAEAWLGNLPETWRVTSRGWENPSGRYLFRKPADLDFTDSALAQFSDDDGNTHVEILRWQHRFSWAPGDTHYKNGELIECFDPDGETCLLPEIEDLPELPERWVSYLRNPPVAQSTLAYTRPSDGPEWWLSQADQTLGTRAELAQFAFDLIASRQTPDQAMTQLRRVALALNPGEPWEDEHLWGLVDANTQRKAAEVAEREDEALDSLPASRLELDQIARAAYDDLNRRQEIIGHLEPQVPYNEEIAKEAQAQLPDTQGIIGNSLQYKLRKMEGFERVLFDQLFRIQAKKDAATLLAGEFTGFEDIAYLPAPPEPSMFHILGKDTPGSNAVAEKTVTVLAGARAAGKTWITAAWAAQELRAGNRVIWIDFERQPAPLIEKLVALKVQRHTIQGNLQYTHRLPAPEQLVEYIQDGSAYGTKRVLLVVDAFRGLQGMVSPGTSANDGDAVEAVYLEYLNPAIEAGATVCLLDHLPKAGGATFGSERKESAADYVITVEQVVAFTKEQPGYSTMTLTKDRYGNIAAGTTIGHLWVPGDGSSSAAEGITKYPDIPTLRNWAPETEATLADLPEGMSEKARKEQAILDEVRANPLKFGPRPLAKHILDVYPGLFSSIDAVTAFTSKLHKAGKLTQDSTAKYDLPGDQVHVSERPAIDPAVLQHEYEDEVE